MIIIVLVIVDCCHAVVVVVSRVKMWLMTEATHQRGAKGRCCDEGGSHRSPGALHQQGPKVAQNRSHSPSGEWKTCVVGWRRGERRRGERRGGGGGKVVSKWGEQTYA